MIEIIGWIASIVVLGSYAYMVKSGNVYQYDVLNFITAIPLIVLAVSKDAIPNAFLSGAFCMIALWGIIRANRSRKRASQETWKSALRLYTDSARGADRIRFRGTQS